jgi:ABC-type amino acid transport substrate-binding protein
MDDLKDIFGEWYVISRDGIIAWDELIKELKSKHADLPGIAISISTAERERNQFHD